MVYLYIDHSSRLDLLLWPAGLIDWLERCGSWLANPPNHPRKNIRGQKRKSLGEKLLSRRGNTDMY